MRSLLVFALAATSVACAQPQAENEEAGPDPAPQRQNEDRGAAAGLTAAQADTLRGYASGAVVPTPPEGWQLTSFSNETISDGGFLFPGYTLAYRRADGACFNLMAASEGLGDVFVMEPPHMSEATAPQIALYGPIPVGWTEPDDPEDEWEGDYLASEWFGTDGLFFHIDSSDGEECTRINADDARTLLEGMRYLDPADDALAGLWTATDLPEQGGENGAPDPEADARDTYADAEATTRVETVRTGEHIRLVLVTNEGLQGSSIRDQRFRVAYLRYPEGGWRPQAVGNQQRCQSGRGHQDWGTEPCQ